MHLPEDVHAYSSG